MAARVIFPAVTSMTLAFVLGASTAYAADSSVGRGIAANCAACHGTNGRSNSAIPALAGRQKTEIIELMQAFKSGQRPATVMHQIAKGYTEEQIAAAAEYFAAQ